MKRLSIGEKREFYANLARLIRSGTALPNALELMARDSRSRPRAFVRALGARVKEGEPLGDALIGLRPKVSELEASIVSASGRAGRLDRGCDQLARYFDALDRARREVKSRVAYPFIMLNFLILVMNAKVAVTSGFNAYLLAIFQQFLMLYALLAAGWVLWGFINESARHSASLDGALRVVPGLGPIRERFALARFLSTLDAQLEAQVNVWDAVANAARTSDSARIISAARAAIPMLQAGERLSDVLAVRNVIPEDYARSFRIAEQAGELDAELAQLAQQSEEMAVASLNRWSEWLPKIIYVAVLLYGAWQVVAMYQGYINQVNSINPFQN